MSEIQKAETLIVKTIPFMILFQIIWILFWFHYRGVGSHYPTLDLRNNREIFIFVIGDVIGLLGVVILGVRL